MQKTPYYKIQYFCKTSLSWKDIQIAYPTKLDAKKTIRSFYHRYPTAIQFRVMEVYNKHRIVCFMDEARSSVTKV